MVTGELLRRSAMRFNVRRRHAPWWHAVCTVVLVMLAVGACSPIAREGDYSPHEFTLHSGELDGLAKAFLADEELERNELWALLEYGFDESLLGAKMRGEAWEDEPLAATFVKGGAKPWRGAGGGIS